MPSAAPKVNCPSCGAQVKLANRFIRLAVCEYCRQTMHVTRDGVDPTGKTASLTDGFSVLKLNARGHLEDRGFQVLGRLRFAYEDGYWDEWYLLFDDGSEAWIHEDEGDLTLIRREELVGSPPRVESLRAGARAKIGELAVVVTERGSATIAGGEGQLPLAVRPGEKIDYVDANAAGRIVMLEYTQAGVELYLGEALDEDTLELEESYA